MLYGDMARDREAFLQQIYGFIGVRDIQDKDKVCARVNVRTSRLPRVSRPLTDLAPRAQKSDLNWLYKGVKSLGIQKLLGKPLSAKSPLELDGSLREKIMTETSEDVARLDELTGMNLAARWK